MESRKYRTVVEGEASESDDDDVDKCQSAAEAPHGVVVSGEASESEEETDTRTQNNQEFPALKVDFQKSETDLAIDPLKLPTLETTRMVTSRPKYDTLLHRKLRERNLTFHHHLVEAGSQTYLSSAKQLQTITQHLLKSHKSIQDISHNMRLLTNDLFHLEDKIDIIATCHLLPDINIQVSK